MTDNQYRGALADRVAIITGAGHGIGKAYAERFAHEGAKLLLTDIDGGAVDENAAALRANGVDAYGLKVDVRDVDDIERMVSEAIKTFHRIDVLVNNAALFATVPMSRSPFNELEIEEWDRMMEINLRGPWLAARAVYPAMKEQQYGKIINISSATALMGSAGRLHYVASKAGILGFTKTLAREMGPAGITVNCISPGSTLSEESPDEATLAMRRAGADRRALARVQSPEDLVGAAVFFASADSDFITGQTLVVDGGAFMH